MSYLNHVIWSWKIRLQWVYIHLREYGAPCNQLLDWSIKYTDLLDVLALEHEPVSVPTIFNRITHNNNNQIRLDWCMYFVTLPRPRDESIKTIVPGNNLRNSLIPFSFLVCYSTAHGLQKPRVISLCRVLIQFGFLCKLRYNHRQTSPSRCSEERRDVFWISRNLIWLCSVDGQGTGIKIIIK